MKTVQNISLSLSPFSGDKKKEKEEEVCFNHLTLLFRFDFNEVHFLQLLFQQLVAILQKQREQSKYIQHRHNFFLVIFI
jgi:hypothetical protein